MPNYHNHLIGGAVTYGITLFTVTKLNLIPNETSLYLQCFITCLFGSLFPDIDTKSKIQMHIYPILFALTLGLILYGFKTHAAIIGAIAMIPLIVHHRSITHRSWFIVLIAILANLIYFFAYEAINIYLIWNSGFFVLGALSHIFLDMGWRKLLKT